MTQSSAIKASPSADPRESNVKETVEQILIAFILAFIFRCFIVEAFVIPTGSMAPTLLGAHMDFRCPDCGWHWKVNYSGESDGDDVRVPAFADETYPIRCPNCGFKLPKLLPGDEANDASFPAVAYGDRILVQKYLYLLGEPDRWDVVVFKSPDVGSISRYSGVEPYTQNYIKRLIGRPNETIMVLDGDIYASKSAKPTNELTPADFTVQTKPYDAQEALWRIVYDNDHHPRGLPRTYLAQYEFVDPSGGKRLETRPELSEKPWRQPWVQDDASAAWDTGGRTFKFDHAEGKGTLRYDLESMEEKHPMTDWLAYDVTQGVARSDKNGWSKSPYGSINNVSDVKLALSYRRLGGEGALKLKLTKQDYQFTAEFGSDKAKLYITRPDSTEPALLGEVPLKFGSAFRRIEFASADYRVSVRVDGREILATTPEQFHPDIPALLSDFELKRQRAPATAIISADRVSCELEHVSLWRDVYYLNQDWPGQYYFWAMPDNFPNGNAGGQLIRLGPDEFFTMGDNSLLSSDARVWRTPVALPYERLEVKDGRVPRRFLLGKAFFVYWPAGYAPLPSLPGFVPNFGEMRFIH
jgi:signal peptidase I